MVCVYNRDYNNLVICICAAISKLKFGPIADICTGFSNHFARWVLCGYFYAKQYFLGVLTAISSFLKIPSSPHIRYCSPDIINNNIAMIVDLVLIFCFHEMYCVFKLTMQFMLYYFNVHPI